MTAPHLMEQADEDGFKPIHLAVIQGTSETVNLLLANKVDVNALDNEGHSVVHWATGYYSLLLSPQTPFISHRPIYRFSVRRGSDTACPAGGRRRCNNPRYQRRYAAPLRCANVRLRRHEEQNLDKAGARYPQHPAEAPARVCRGGRQGRAAAADVGRECRLGRRHSRSDQSWRLRRKL